MKMALIFLASLQASSHLLKEFREVNDHKHHDEEDTHSVALSYPH